MARPSLLLSLLAACAPEERAREAPSPAEPAFFAVAPPPPVPATEVRTESPRLPIDPDAVRRATELAAGEAWRGRLGLTLDRPLYRPGETVWARVWDRAAPPPGADRDRTIVQVQLVDPRGAVVQTLGYAHTGAGASAAVDVPHGVAGGLYRLRATVAGQMAERPFVVAAFEEPRIRKELDLLRDAYGPGDEVVAALTVASSGRGPLADHPVKVLVSVEGQALPEIETRTDTRGEATLRFRLPAAMRRPDAVVTVLVDEDGWTESVSREIPVVLDAVQVEWFPEGGDWVAGLPARMYLRARDRDGQPADVAGIVVDGEGREVASFRTVHDGLGRFELTPAPGERYAARITEPVALPELVPLPEARAAGCVLRTFDDLDGDRPQLAAGVECTEARAVVLAAAIGGTPFLPAVVEVAPGTPAVVHLRGDRGTELAHGVARVTLLSDALEPLAERLVYRNRERKLRVGLEPDRSRYGPRDEVSLRVVTRDPDGEPVDADVAIAVVDDRLLKHADDERGHLLTQLHLDPWLSGTLEDPAWYLDPAEPEAGLGLDLVMGTFGWRRFALAPREDKAKASKSVGEVGLRKLTEAPPVAPENVGALGTVGVGLGGTVQGLGGLGTRGMGSGASGYGIGGGGFGAKGEGGIGVVSGDPIILGALDRSIVDEVVKRV